MTYYNFVCLYFNFYAASYITTFRRLLYILLHILIRVEWIRALFLFPLWAPLESFRGMFWTFFGITFFFQWRSSHPARRISDFWLLRMQSIFSRFMLSKPQMIQYWEIARNVKKRLEIFSVTFQNEDKNALRWFPLMEFEFC